MYFYVNIQIFNSILFKPSHRVPTLVYTTNSLPHILPIPGELIDDDNLKLETSVDQPISFAPSDKSLEDRVHLHEESHFSDDSSQVTSSNVPHERLDIGCFTDADIPLKYACRYLASSFLLTGNVGELIPDKYFRVSVKSLALTCIGNILRLYPTLLSATLAKNPSPIDGRHQMIADILLFAKHSDPQIRGNVMIVVGSYLTAVYARSRGSYDRMEKESAKLKGGKAVPLENLVELLVRGLEDDSTTACRQTLSALNFCFTDLLESEDNQRGIILLDKLLRLVDNPYFLVKVLLAQVLSELPYIAVRHITGSFDFQDNVVSVLLVLLADQDPRIRTATSEAIVR